jgi:hypothetical protein
MRRPCRFALLSILISGLALLGALGLTACELPQPRFHITTVPVSAEVWLDGERLGSTPFDLSLTGSISHTLELHAPGYLPVTYEFDGGAASAELSIKLFPRFYFHTPAYPDQDILREVLEGDTYDCQNGDQVVCRESSLISSRITQHAQAPSWEYWATAGETLSAIRPQNPAEPIILATQRVDDPQTRAGEYPWGLVFAPDGETVAYTTAPDPLVRCANRSSHLWQASLTQPGKRTLKFDGPENAINVCDTPYGFSPDTRWLWNVYRGERAQGDLYEYHLRLVMTAPTESRPIDLGPVGWEQYRPLWSADSQWLAIQTQSIDPATSIYHLDEGQWQLSADNLKGAPVGWSADSRSLWLLNLPETSSAVVDIVSIPNGTPKNTINLGLFHAYTMGSVSWSPQGTQFALTFAGKDTLDYQASPYLPGRLLIGRSDLSQQHLLTDDDYVLVFYWLPDNQRLATLVERADTEGYTQTWMKIVDAPDSAHP